MELQPEETEFDSVDDISPSQSLSRADRLKNFFRTNKLRFLTRKKMRDVRVTFVDFSKPYLAKISSPDNYKSFLNIGNRAGIKTQCFVKIQLKAIKFSTFSRLCFAAATLLQLSKLIEMLFVLFRRFRKTLIARRLCRLSFWSLQWARGYGCRRARASTRWMESRTVTSRGRDSDTANCFSIEDPPLNRAQAKTRHHSLERNNRRRLVWHQEREREQCVSYFGIDGWLPQRHILLETIDCCCFTCCLPNFMISL